jgi:hypothetical protein
MSNIHEANFLLFAAKYYDNPQCIDIAEFYEDLNRFKYIKRLFNKYRETGELRETLIVNHIRTLYNVFTPPEYATRMLFFKLQGYEEFLKPFLVYLNFMPEKVTGLGIQNLTILSSDIPMDTEIINRLRKL